MVRSIETGGINLRILTLQCPAKVSLSLATSILMTHFISFIFGLNVRNLNYVLYCVPVVYDFIVNFFLSYMYLSQSHFWWAL